ncbi:hypothetical protein A3731_01705 [Roseovarius sp. HI0049]|nr:hypothetical protein A3731_01705 [Roseovarius sp. HI0049]
MRKRLTPEGGTFTQTLAAIRKRLEDRPDGALRPEELALLEDWYTECEDPEQRRRLGQIMRVLGRDG